MDKYPDVSIVVVTWNVAEALRECVSSLEAHADVPYELFVIDNGSTDATPHFLDRWSPTQPLCLRYDRITNTDDLGYATAANMGIRRAAAPTVLLLNPDTRITPQSLSHMLAEARRYPDAGLVGCRITNGDGSHQSSVSELPTIWRQIENRFGLLKKTWYTHLTKRAPFIHNYAAPAAVPQIKGAVALITTAALALVGEWDDGYFLWFEDSDYCKRVHDAGLTVRYTPNATIAHKSEAGISTMPFWERFFIWNRSIRRYFRRHHGRMAGWTIAVVDPVALFAALALKRLRVL